MANSTRALTSAVLNELAGAFGQGRRVLQLSTNLGHQVLLAETLRGEEEISHGFRFEVVALSLDAAITLKLLLAQPVLLQLLTAAGLSQIRPFHGHVTAVECTGADGGFARYQLTIEPWTSFLAVGRDSRVFQDKTVLDILDSVFNAYGGKGTLAPAWRYDIQDRSRYLQRSITTQYQESDLAFVERLMHQEGLFYFFEHEGDPERPNLGSHTLVIADHNGAFKANVQPDIRYSQPGAVMREDTLDRWRITTRMQTNNIELASWDYRSRQMREVSSSGTTRPTLISRDVPGAYAYPTREQGQRIADNQLQAFEASKELHAGAGTVRTFAPGTRFTLYGHSKFDGGEEAGFTILRVRHLAHNNLRADTGNALTRLLGQCRLKEANLADLASSPHAVGEGLGERPVYRNCIDAIRSSVPYRPSRTDGHGRLLHPRPLVHGQQTAVVVGPPGAVIHTDREHRIKIQFHWQRGEASHSRLAHPVPDGHVGAPADDRTGTWVRVATALAPMAGANWGSHALPRVGQEVLVDFLDGDIDRPVVIGALFNGAGQPDTQYNRVVYGGGASTGNAPMWFPGEGDGHAHPAVLSGIKTQALQDSQSGVGAFSQLVFDDSAGQARIALQRHASVHRGTAELNLGHLRHQVDNQRLDPVGFGAELKTDHSAALRAGRGMLLSTDQASPGGAHLDSRPAANQIAQARQLMADLAGTAQKHNARLPSEPDAAMLPAILDLARTSEIVQATDEGARGSATGYSEPHMQLSSPAGIVATTPASAVFSSGNSSVLSAGQDINVVSQGGLFHGVRNGISLFTYGKAGNSDKPVKETGIRLHAANGKLSTQSQAGTTKLIANKSITVASVAKSIQVAAREHVLLTAQGAYIRLTGGNIELHGLGKIEFKATVKELAGPVSNSLDFPTMPRESHKYAQRFHLKDAAGTALAGQPYTVYVADRQEFKGKTDAQGMTALIDTESPERTYIIFDRDLQWICEEESNDAPKTPGC